jgi:hypothetical protein
MTPSVLVQANVTWGGGGGCSGGLLKLGASVKILALFVLQQHRYEAASLLTHVRAVKRHDTGYLQITTNNTISQYMYY